MKKYKYITIQQDFDEMQSGKPLYRIYNNRSKHPLGYLYYYPQWREYVFQTFEDIVFNKGCLLDIIDFIDTVITPLLKPRP